IVTHLMNSLTIAFSRALCHSSQPVPQGAIGVGSAFQGWAARAQGLVCTVLVPLDPPPGHTFHLERDAAGLLPGRRSRIRVELQCTCTGQRPPQDLLRILHGSQGQLARAQELGLLHTLGCGHYLDVHRTSCCFHKLLASARAQVPQSHECLRVVPSRHTFKLQLSRGTDSPVLGIFLSTHPAEPQLPLGTAWPECYMVAEAKFQQHVARDSVTLRCLELLARALGDTHFPPHVLKTIVMHLLTTLPLSHWHRRHFLQRLEDIVGHLCHALHRKHLGHFIVGNCKVPAEISLPWDIQTAEPLNLFQQVAEDPAAHTRAMSEF
ncbi:IPIL1 protein, partial [Melanocharis versteri]|nr:IPIL1 protein [Melanocharis versteri]